MRDSGKADKRAARGERLAAALRENLRRRKARERELKRAAGETGEQSATDASSEAKVPPQSGPPVGPNGTD